MSTERDDMVFKAKLCEQVERFDEMVEHMKKIAQIPSELTVEERNLISVAYKNVVGSRRTAWRVVQSMQQKEEAKGEVAKKNELVTIQMYKAQIEKELGALCDDILNLLDKNILPNSVSAESEVFFNKMKGDYYRYMTEFSVEEKRKQASENALAAYKVAQDVAEADLATTHPIRLGLALNFSVLYYEALNSPEEACKLAQSAYDNAIVELGSLQDETYRDAALIMQLLRDNLTLWTVDSFERAEILNNEPTKDKGIIPVPLEFQQQDDGREDQTQQV